MRLLPPLFASLAGAAFVLPAASVPAHAGTLDITCAVSSDVSMSPGLTLNNPPVMVTADVDYTGCVSGSRPDIVSGERHGTFRSERTCLVTPEGDDTTVVITWNTGETSTVAYEPTVATVGGQTVFTATLTVVAGVFADAMGEEVVVQAAPDLLACLTTGVTHQTGIGTFSLAGA